MNLRSIVWKELWERPAAMVTSLAAILLGVTALVAIQHVTIFSEREVALQLSALGANILVLPKGASLQDYYSADMNGETIPEEDVAQIVLASLTGVERLAPKLSVPVHLDGQAVTLTGILPQRDFEAKAAWQTATFMKKEHASCTKAATAPSGAGSPDSLSTQRTIEDLGRRDAVLGAEIATALKLQAGDQIELLGESFKVLAVLSPSGTVDDSRVFAHLHSVQELAKTGEVVSVIEVLGCCEDAAGDLVPQLGELLPNAKVVTISQVVETQVGVNQLMAKATTLMIVVMVVVGGASVMGTISSNVRERRREIGTMMALGATPGLASRLFLLKASWLGLVGGVGGSLVGTLAAVALGPYWAGVRVDALPSVGIIACICALLLTLAAAYWPARQAAQLDPCNCFREV